MTRTMTAPMSELDSTIDDHWPRVFRIALSVVRDSASAEDAAQETFVKLVAARRRGTPIEDLGAWLATVVLNESRRMLRSKERRERREVAARPRTEGAMDPTAAVREYAESLPEKLRLPLVLHFGLGLTHAEIGAALGDPKPTVTSRIQAGIEQIRKDLIGAGSLASFATAPLVESGLSDGWSALRAAPVPKAPTASSLERVGRGSLRLPGARALTALAALGSLALVASFALALREPGPEGPSPDRGAIAAASPPAAPLGTGALAEATAFPPLQRPDDATARAAAGGAPREPAIPAGAGGSSAVPPEKARALTGRVVDAERRPVPGVRVVLRSRAASTSEDPSPFPELTERLKDLVDDLVLPERHEELAVAETDAAGCFSFERPPETGKPLSVAAALVERGRGFYGKVAMPRGAVETGDIVLASRPLVTLTIRGRGASAAGARVTVQEIAPPEPATRQLVASADGVVELVAHRRDILVTVEHAGYAIERKHLSAVTADRKVDLELVPETTLTGRVIDAQGAPVMSASVHAVDPELATPPLLSFGSSSVMVDRDGRFTLHGLASGRRYEVHAEPPAPFRATMQAVTLPVAALDLTCKSGCAVRLAARFPDGPAAPTAVLEGAEVILQREAKPGVWTEFETTYGVACEAQDLAVVEPGTYRAVVGMMPKFVRARSAPFVVGPADRAHTVVVDLHPGRRAHGKIVTRAGAPLAGVMVTWTDDETIASAVSKDDGTFELAELPAEDATLEITSLRHRDAKVVAHAMQEDLGTIVLDADEK